MQTLQHSGKISQCLLSRVSRQLPSLSASASGKEVCRMCYVCVTQDTVYIVVPKNVCTAVTDWSGWQVRLPFSRNVFSTAVFQSRPPFNRMMTGRDANALWINVWEVLNQRRSGQQERFHFEILNLGAALHHHCCHYLDLTNLPLHHQGPSDAESFTADLVSQVLPEGNNNYILPLLWKWDFDSHISSMTTSLIM